MYLDNTMNTVTSTGVLPFDAVEDMNKIIDLSANIPEKLKPVLKKNATNTFPPPSHFASPICLVVCVVSYISEGRYTSYNSLIYL
jgi:hypothetical protein